jgi:hypothetical protein
MVSTGQCLRWGVGARCLPSVPLDRFRSLGAARARAGVTVRGPCLAVAMPAQSVCTCARVCFDSVQHIAPSQGCAEGALQRPSGPPPARASAGGGGAAAADHPLIITVHEEQLFFAAFGLLSIFHGLIARRCMALQRATEATHRLPLLAWQRSVGFFRCGGGRMRSGLCQT